MDSHSAALRLASLASLDSLMTLLHKQLCSSTHTWGEKKTHCALVVKANMVRAMGSPIKQIFSVEDEGGSAWFTVHHCFAMILADVAGSTGTSLSVLLFGFRQKACSWLEQMFLLLGISRFLFSRSTCQHSQYLETCCFTVGPESKLVLY